MVGDGGGCGDGCCCGGMIFGRILLVVVILLAFSRVGCNEIRPFSVVAKSFVVFGRT